jgi:hypothetical protein
MAPGQPGMMHPQMQVPGAIPHAPMQQGLQQTGYGYAQPQGVQQQPGMHMQAAPAATIAQPQAAPQGGLSMLRMDSKSSQPQASAGALQKPRSATSVAKPAPAKPAARPSPATKPAAVAAPVESPRIQPRNQPMPTPGSGKKRLVYASVFVVIALGVGAFVAKMVLSVL